MALDPITYCYWWQVVPENLHISTKDGYLVCTPLPPGISSLALYFPFKYLAV